MNQIQKRINHFFFALSNEKNHSKKTSHQNKFWKLIEEHYQETKSEVAKEILADKEASLKKFCWIVPKEQQEKQTQSTSQQNIPVKARTVA